MLTKTEKVTFVKERKKAAQELQASRDSPAQGHTGQAAAVDEEPAEGKHKVRNGQEEPSPEDNRDRRAARRSWLNDLTDTSAIILSNEDPFELYGKFKSNSLRLAAKPGQMSPDDVDVQCGRNGHTARPDRHGSEERGHRRPDTEGQGGRSQRTRW